MTAISHSDSPTPWGAARRRVLPLLLTAAALAAVLVLRLPGADRLRLAWRALLGDGAPTATAGAANSPAGPAAAATATATATTAAGVLVTAEGRLVTYPGAQVVVGADVAGTVVFLPVHERDHVRQGEVVAELRADDARSALAAAAAKVAEADADARFAAKDADRARFLADNSAGTVRDAERAAAARDAAGARLATAQAEVRRLTALLAKNRIAAPIDGTVTERPIQPGEHIEAGAPLLTLADLRRTRIEAEVDEFDAGHVAPGAPVRVTVEGYEGRTFRAHVEEIPDSVVARKLRPQDPGRPADTRVLLVKIALDEPNPIKLGQRVEVAIAPPPPPPAPHLAG